ncbi:hypothetical protein ACH5A3_43560 [Streptomyces echinatus]|uniref:hypothetical protein n=1 Tax=Streptomyces echinatus TaxID=67293 RepID=UPI0037A25F97
MGSEQGRQASVRDRAEALGLGEERGGYAVAGLWGALAQLARRFLAGVFVALLVCLVVLSSGFQKGVITMGAVMLSLFGLTLAWRGLSARFGLRRCYLYTRGLVVTSTFGRVRHVVAWTEVTELKWMSNLTLLLAFHRFEIEQRGAGRVAFLALGIKPQLVDALQTQAGANGVR